MIPEYGIHPAHDVACAGNSLRRAIRDIYEAENVRDVVGLGTVVAMMDVVADALDREWHAIRPEVA